MKLVDSIADDNVYEHHFRNLHCGEKEMFVSGVKLKDFTDIDLKRSSVASTRLSKRRIVFSLMDHRKWDVFTRKLFFLRETTVFQKTAKISNLRMGNLADNVWTGRSLASTRLLQLQKFEINPNVRKLNQTAN